MLRLKTNIQILHRLMHHQLHLKDNEHQDKFLTKKLKLRRSGKPICNWETIAKEKRQQQNYLVHGLKEKKNLRNNQWESGHHLVRYKV